jgi:DNA repair protein RadD
MLTTGIDIPDIDLIAMLRATDSPIIHVQTIGRGCRVAEGKTHCLVLDFAGNTKRLGPIDNVLVKEKGDKKGKGAAITKDCPDCDVINHASARFCISCDYEFPRAHKLELDQFDGDIISEKKKPAWSKVSRTVYKLHEAKNTGNRMIKVTYYGGVAGSAKIADEWICIEFPNNTFRKRQAIKWLKNRLFDGLDVDRFYDCDAFLNPKNIRLLKTSESILVDTNGKFPEVLDHKICQKTENFSRKYINKMSNQTLVQRSFA